MNTFLMNNVRIVTEYGVVENGFIYVKRGIIVNVGKSNPGRIHRSCSRIDGNGGWLFPGFIDISNTQLAEGDNSSFAGIEENLSRHGVTSVFHMISRLDEDNEYELNRFRSLGVIRHHFRTKLQMMNSYYIVGAPIIRRESGIRPPEPDLPEQDVPEEEKVCPNSTVSDMASHPSVYVICSDSVDYPILQSVYTLCNHYGVSLADAIGMISINPARAMGVDRRLGSIEWGKRADLVLTAGSTDYTDIGKVFVNGCLVYEKNSAETGKGHYEHYPYQHDNKVQTL